jgi:hypothetical protein
MNKLYQKSIKNTKERFLRLINTIQERGIMNNTLIIFTSDHGELLGERKYGGIFGHGTPIAPEIIRVPTVFIGAGLPNKILSSSTLSGVDIAPTLLEAQDRRKAQYMDGVDVWNQSFPQHPRRSMIAVGIPKTLKQTYLGGSYISISFSNISGTTVYNLHNRLAGFRKFQNELDGYVRGSPRNKYKNIFNLLSVYTSNKLTYGNMPEISRNQIPDELLSDTNIYEAEYKNIQSKLDSIRCGLE